MLNKLSRDLLKLLNRTEPEDLFVFPWYQLEELTGLEYEEIYPRIVYLEKCGYLEYDFTIMKDGSRENLGACLTETGRHYDEFRWLAVKEFFIRSILTPIIVAFITTMLTAYFLQLI